MTELKKPQFVLDLEKYYGEPSQEGFGSAVFFKMVKTADLLEQIAQEQYQYFVGDKWQDWGPETWLAPWKEVYRRPAGAEQDIIAELKGIEDFDAQMSVDMILNNIENAAEAQKALAAAFDASDEASSEVSGEDSVSQLRVYNIGDGEAMAGLLIAGRRETGAATFLVFLMD